MARLRITTGPLEGQTIELDGDLTLGRENTDLEIADLELSRRHCVVRRVSGRVEVEDLGSKNGTFVDGQRIEGAVLVGGGAQIQVGGTTFVVEGVLPVGAAPSSEPLVDTAKTRIQNVPDELRRAPAAGPAPAAPSPPQGGPAMPAMPVGEFRPPSQHHQRGLATRSLIPVLLSYGSAIATAAGLVVYFGTR